MPARTFPFSHQSQPDLHTDMKDSDLHMLTKQESPFARESAQYAATTAPSLADWEDLWSYWDKVTLDMIPETELNNKPIKLRNACVFYLGHIPTFLDIHISKATGEPLCNDKYPSIFERGIDPDVDNPEHCHAHSEIPDEWPAKEDIIRHQEKVRNRVRNLYSLDSIPRKLRRSLWLGFEHEIMHLETLLYMLLQSDRTNPPPRTLKPDFEDDARKAAASAVKNEWFVVPQQDITIGLEDPEDNSGPDQHFGW